MRGETSESGENREKYCTDMLFFSFIFMDCESTVSGLTKINVLIIICNNAIFFIWFIRFKGKIFDHIYYNLENYNKYYNLENYNIYSISFIDLFLFTCCDNNS